MNVGGWKDVPERALLALCGETVEHAIAQLEAFDGSPYLHDFADLLACVPVRFDDETPDHPQ